MRTISTYVDVDVQLDGFSTEDLQEELRYRGVLPGANTVTAVNAFLDTLERAGAPVEAVEALTEFNLRRYWDELAEKRHELRQAARIRAMTRSERLRRLGERAALEAMAKGWAWALGRLQTIPDNY